MDPIRQQWLTLALLVTVTIFVVLSDLWLANMYGAAATYSRVSALLFERWPILYPILIFGLGVLTGHLGLPQYLRPR